MITHTKVRDFNYTRYENGIMVSKFADMPMKEVFISFALTTLNVVYTIGGEFEIDCILASNSNYGAEGEDGSWDYDRWRSGQADLFLLGFNTLNLQNSKWHYWGLGEFSDKNWGKYIKVHPGFMHNIYFRMNKQRDQICIIDADTIRDFTKVKILFNRKVSNAKNPEDWICVPQEYVKTYNLQPDGTWLLNGPYRGMTPAEFDRRLDIENKQRANEARDLFNSKKN